MVSESCVRGAMFMAVSIAVLLRWSVSLHPHSGQGRPPMYGDYEAQRHWMEITYNLPLKDWYFNTTDNDLLYWGLDYPPLTAYHSFICGYLANRVNVAFVALNSSQGYETYEHKVFMRMTVLVMDLLIYIPAIWWYFSFKRPKSAQGNRLGDGEGAKPFTVTGDVETSNILATYLALIYPGLILIDHGHFQYNCISLGLAVAAVAALCRRFELAASALFCFAVNYKQMELYHALPFFCYLLGLCLPKKGQPFWTGFVRLVKVGSVVVLSFFVIWLPFLQKLDIFLQVLHRLFPLARGVFEDKVANIWCSINVIYKLRQVFSNATMAKICLGTTMVAVVPSSVDLVLRPNFRKFLVCLINSSLAFFLFSFQVHEKSILLAAMPVVLYLPIEPTTCFWFLTMSTFSMLPLIIKDRLLLAYLSLTVFYTVSFFITIDFEFKEPHYNSTNTSTLVFKSKSNDRVNKNSKRSIETSSVQLQSPTLLNRLLRTAFATSLTGCVILTLCIATLKPPIRYPDLYPLLISLYSCGHFLLFFLYFNYRQFLTVPPQNMHMKHD